MAELCGRSEFGITGGAGASELDTTFFTEFRAVRVVVLARRTFHSAILEELRPAVSTERLSLTAQRNVCYRLKRRTGMAQRTGCSSRWTKNRRERC